MAKKILLHTCCGPCGTSVVNHLRDNFWDPTAFFYNPNIHPEEEYKLRLQAQNIFCNKVKMPLIIYGDYGLNLFLDNLIQIQCQDPFEVVPEGTGTSATTKQERCAMCYEMRLEKVASFAQSNCYPFFTSTLLYSVYQDHELIRTIAEQKAHKYHVQFVYFDFRQFWEEGQAKARELELYRQKYCGCIFSKQEREAEKKAKKVLAVS